MIYSSPVSPKSLKITSFLYLRSPRELMQIAGSVPSIDNAYLYQLFQLPFFQ